jgi:hypothetical protein
MTRHSIKEYALAIHQRYHKGSRKLKQRILDEFIAATQMHRKSAIRLLSRPEGTKGFSGRRLPRDNDFLAKLSDRTGIIHPKIDQSSVTVFLKQLT